ncbi:unnamed protein product, partial [Discosporangium mesarthrocarpum]
MVINKQLLITKSHAHLNRADQSPTKNQQKTTETNETAQLVVRGSVAEARRSTLEALEREQQLDREEREKMKKAAAKNKQAVGATAAVVGGAWLGVGIATGGIALAAGLVAMGVTTGAGAVWNRYKGRQERKLNMPKRVILASDKEEVMEEWAAAIATQLKGLKEIEAQLIREGYGHLGAGIGIGMSGQGMAGGGGG